MSSKKSVEVIIDGKVYTLSGYEEENYLQQVASYMNRKIGELRSLEDYSRLHSDMKALLLQLNIADDYFKAKDMIENIEKELEQKEKEIYNLKHEIISKQIKIETVEKRILQSEQENKNLLLSQARLEAVIDTKNTKNDAFEMKEQKEENELSVDKCRVWIQQKHQQRRLTLMIFLKKKTKKSHSPQT